MAFSPGESFSKLPPIKTEESILSEKGCSQTAAKPSDSTIFCGLNRKRHGLVRLPPIVRLDSFQTLENKTQSKESEDLTIQLEPDDYEFNDQTNSFSLGAEPQQPILCSSFTNGSDSITDKDRVRIYTDVKSSDSNFNFIQNPRKKASFFRTRMKNVKVPYDRLHDTTSQKDTALQVESISSLKKVHTTNRMTKTVTDLKRNNTKVPVREYRNLTVSQFRRKIYYSNSKKSSNGKEINSKSERTENDSLCRGEQQKEFQRTINRSYLEKPPNNYIMQKEQNNRNKRNGKRLFSNAKSTPASPTFSKSNSIENRTTGPLDSAYDLIATPSNNKLSLQSSTVENQSTRKSNKLCVEGRNFLPTGRENCKVDNLETENNAKSNSGKNLSKIPSFYDKKDLVFDIQPPSLLNTHETSMSCDSDNFHISNARESQSSSTYDLKQILVSSMKRSEIPERKCKDPVQTTKHFLSVEHSPSVDQNEESRRLSAYDLLEFLQLSNANSNENNTHCVLKRPVIQEQQKTCPVIGSTSLEIPEPSSDSETRRSSKYDLIEFLSLNRPIENAKLETNIVADITESVSDKQNRKKLKMVDSQEGDISKTMRSTSIYDLKEFLAINTLGGKSDKIQESRKSEANNLTLKNGQSEKKFVSSENTQQTQTTRPRLSTHSQKSAKEQMSLLGVNITSNETLNISRKERASSLYDLKEFLSLNTAVVSENKKKSLLVAKDASSGSTNVNKQFLQTEVAPDGIAKRGSVYNLHEFLQVLQDESEKIRDNIQGLKSVSNKETRNIRTDLKDSSGYSTDCAETNTHAPKQTAPEQPPKRKPSVTQLAPDDLVDLLKLTRSQQFAFGRKASNITLLSSAGSLDGPDDVFLCVPGTARKRSSVYDLKEFLGLLNTEESPLRRRLSSVLSKKQSEDNPSPTPEPLSRSDSGEVKSLCDLSEFLATLNKDDSPLRRRLSSASSSVGGSSSNNRTPVQHQDSEEVKFYSLDEILTALNEMASKESETKQNNSAENEIRIPVPNFTHAKTLVEMKDTGTTRNQLKTRLSGSSTLKSVPEYHEVKPSDNKRSSF